MWVGVKRTNAIGAAGPSSSNVLDSSGVVFSKKKAVEGCERGVTFEENGELSGKRCEKIKCSKLEKKMW